jgi:hypothetical protein
MKGTTFAFGGMRAPSALSQISSAQSVQPSPKCGQRNQKIAVNHYIHFKFARWLCYSPGETLKNIKKNRSILQSRWKITSVFYTPPTAALEC